MNGLEIVSNFWNSWGNNQLDVDGFPQKQPFQCVDVFHKINSMIGIPYIKANPLGGAVDYFDNFDGLGLSRWFVKVPNNPNDPNQVPPAGAYMIYGRPFGLDVDGVYYGHVVAVRSADKTGYNGIDQNAPDPFVRLHRYTYANIRGWIVPKVYLNQGDDSVIQSNESEYQRWDGLHYDIRNKHITREYFNANFVGKVERSIIDAIRNNPEADTVRGWQELGKRASEENWLGGIETRDKMIVALGNQLQEEKNKQIDTGVYVPLQNIYIKKTKE